MKKSLLLLLFSVLYCLIAFSQTQLCNNDAPKISFTGKAPSPWAINGKINDWQTILGPYSGNVFSPFSPPLASAFNWVLDIDRCIRPSDPDAPLPESDLHFLSFIHDDYNVYFYFRRQLNGNSANTFYYFIDVNADGVMSLGEPVINASFNKRSVSPLTLGIYIPNRDHNYSEEKKGNFMLAHTTAPVNNFPMPGNVVDIFTSKHLSGYTKLKKNEIFKAAVTEDGYGIELAIPWRFLRNWLSLKKALDPGDIFFYKVSMQEGEGRYREERVVDNAGSCFGGLGVSGNVNLAKSITTSVVNTGSAYKFNFSYTNSTKATTVVGLQSVLINFKKTSELPVNAEDFTIKAYPDNNCNGTVDPGETEQHNFFGEGFFFDSTQNTYSMLFEREPMSRILPPFGKTCYIVDVTLPPNGVVKGFKISFASEVFFVEQSDRCDCCVSPKPINQVGVVEDEVQEEASSVSRKSKINIEAVSSDDVLIYPNPNNGNTTIKIPQNVAGVDIMLEDNLGRNIKQWKGFKANILQVYNLKSGFYIMRMKFKETGKWVTKKIVVQR